MMRSFLVAFACSCLVGCGARTGIDESSGGGGTASVPVGSGGTPNDHTVDCTQEGITYIYAITEDRTLYRFDPTKAQFHSIGTVGCSELTQVNSMAVDRRGIAYVESESGLLFRVDVGTAACTPTDFVPGQLGWAKFGMGYATDPIGAGGAGTTETLFVADASDDVESRGLARFEPDSLTLSFVGPFSQPLGTAVELTGTGDGRLFALGMPQNAATSRLAQIDSATGVVETLVELPVTGSAFAFAFWGGNFYTFTAETGVSTTTVSRYDPNAQTTTPVATLNGVVVGVGVSTCAPE
jgi:hypothetical protein